MNYDRYFNKNSIQIVILSVFGVFSLTATTLAWTEPTLTPPSGNVSFTGSQWTTGSGLIYYNGGNVGIGKTSASNPLDVVGYATFANNGDQNTIISLTNDRDGTSRDPWLLLRKRTTAGAPASVGALLGQITFDSSLSAGTSAEIRSTVTVVGNNAGGWPAGADLNFMTAPGNAVTAAQSRLYIASAGNVGVGTTSPSQALSVNGTIYSGTGGFKFPDGTTQTTAGGGGSSQWTTSSSDIYYNTGAVTVGATSPNVGAKLDVVGQIRGTSMLASSDGSRYVNFPGTPAMQFYNGVWGSAAAPITWANEAGTHWTQSVYSAANDLGMKFTSYAGEVLYLNPAGAVGIGTVAPDTNLTVYGAYGAAYGNLYLRTNDTVAQDKGGAISFGGSYTGTTPTYFAQIGGYKESGVAGEYDSYLSFETRSDSGPDMREVMRIDSSGNVGIGTSAPGSSAVTGLGFSYSAALHVAGSARPSPTFSGTGVDFRFIDTNASANVKAGDIVYDDQIFKFRGLTDAGAAKNDPTLAIDVNTGSVGIGTASPNGMFVVGGGTASTYNDITFNGATTANYGSRLGFAGGGTEYAYLSREGRVAGGTSNNFLIRTSGATDLKLGTNGADNLTIQSGGNVGIGTTNPGSLLTVNGKTSLLTFTETISATGNSGAAATINFALGSVNTITLTANTTLSFSNATAGQSVTIFLKQDATGSRTVTWPTMLWSGGTAPTLTTTAAKTDIVTVFYDGTNYYGFLGGTNY